MTPARHSRLQPLSAAWAALAPQAAAATHPMILLMPPPCLPTTPGSYHSPMQKRLPGLDLVRALAISWVMLYHASILWHVPGDSWIVRFGWMGVDLFFALSGFLIAGQLLRPWARGTAPRYSHFMMRRLLRT